ncbi:MAG: prenyltransferase/squalene oxidase repeat-containing protein, partial [Planctomycetota bacterium]
PMAGAAASLTDHGAPVPEAVARRDVASQQEPGANSVAAARDVTMKHSAAGANLPTAAAETEAIPEAGTGGVTVAQGPSPSTLETGPSATVRQAAADVAVSQRTTPAGSEEAGLGSARVVALAGKARTTSEDIPTPSASRAAPALGRTTAVAVGAAPAEAEPAAEHLAGGPTAESGSAEPSGPPTTTIATAAVAREAGGVASAGPSEATGELAGPEGGAVTIDQTNRAARLDAMPSATAAGAMAGPRRTMGAIEAPGTSEAAAELADAGTPTGGADAAPDIAAQANIRRPQSQSFGLPGNLMAGTAVDSATESGPAATTPGKVAGQRRLPQGDEPGPSLAAEVGRGPARRMNAPGLPTGASEAIAEEPVASSATAAPGEAMVAAEGTGMGEPSRKEGGLPVQIAAMAGPGGLSDDSSLDVGLLSRQARRESEIVHTVSRRFVVERSGGQLAIDGRVREEPAKAFRQRDVGQRGQVARSRGGTVGTEKAVEMGLDYFARNQFPDGHWSLHELPPGARHEDDGLAQMKSDSAATGLALLSYLGAGYTHLDEKHRDVVRRGVDWLVKNQKEDGDLFGEAGGTSYARFYSHGIATIALCEAYGMTKDPELREPARKAVDYIVKSQHAEQGGWRYRPGEESDTSVTGWQMMALKSAQMAGLDVPDEAMKKIDHWLDLAANPSGDGRYVYNPYAKREEQIEGRKPSRAMTAEAMLMRMYLGHDKDDPELIAGAEYLKKNLPAVGSPDRSLRDCYYWYYATQAMFHMQGEYWQAWNDNLRPLAQRSQIEEGAMAGSWHPKDPVPDRWGHAGGRHYVTAMHLLMLEVYYRHLPLFKELGGPPEAAEPAGPSEP